MRLHSIIPWPPATFQPARKEEKTEKKPKVVEPKTVEQGLELSATRVNRAPPSKQDFEDEDSPGENVDITV